MSIRSEVLVPQPSQPYEQHRARGPLWLAGAIALIAAGLTAASLTLWRGVPTPRGQDLTETYASPIGYTIMYPSNWVASRFEGHDQLRPVALPSLEQGRPTFAIDITTPDLSSGPPCSVQPNVIKIGGGKLASGCEIPQPGGAVDAWYVAAVGSPQVNLVVHVVANTPELWSQYSSTLRAMLSTLDATAA